MISKSLRWVSGLAIGEVICPIFDYGWAGSRVM